MDILTQDQAFNFNFYDYCNKKMITLSETNYIQTLIEYCAYNNYIDENIVENLNIMIRESITEYIFEEINEEGMPKMYDMANKYSKYSPKYINTVNRYFMELNNPFKATEILLNEDFTDVIKKGFENDEIITAALLTKYYNLLKMNPLLYNLHRNYRAMMNTLKKSIQTMSYVDDSLMSYQTLDGEDSTNITSYQDIDRFLDKLIIEAKIINKFNKSNVERILRKINLLNRAEKNYVSINMGIYDEEEDYCDCDVDEYSMDELTIGEQNFCRVLLSNYILNVILLNNQSIRLSDIALNTIYLDIDTITKEEIIDVINNNFSYLTENEKNYIINNFTNYIESTKTTVVRN